MDSMEPAETGTSSTKEPVLQPVQFVSIKGIPLLNEIKQEPLDEAECEEQQMQAAHSASAVWLPVKTEPLCGDPLGQETLPSDWSRGKQVPDLHQSQASVNLLNQVAANFGVCKREPADALEAVQGPVWEQAGRCVAEDAVGAGSSCGTALPSESRVSLAPGPQTRAGWQQSSSAASRGDTRRGQGTSGTSAALPVSNSQSETLELTDNHNSLPSKKITKKNCKISALKYECEKCPKHFVRKGDLLRHFIQRHLHTLSHEYEINRIVTLMSKRSSSKSQLQKIKSIEIKINATNKKELETQKSDCLYTKLMAFSFTCYKCKRLTDTGSLLYLRKHYRIFHRHKEPFNISKIGIGCTIMYTCKICEKRFQKFTLMQSHILLQHTEKNIKNKKKTHSLSVDKVSKSVSADGNMHIPLQNADLQNHSTSVNINEISNIIKLEPCDLPQDSNFASEVSLADAQHSGVASAAACTSKQVKSEPPFTSHMLPLKTDSSTWEFEKTKMEISENALEEINKTVNSNSLQVQKTSCPNCPFTCNKMQDYTEHVESQFCINLVFECMHCNATFKDQKYFKRHCNNVHNNIYCFKCYICSVCYKNYFNLAHHRARYHNRKIVFCTRCLNDVPLENYVNSHFKYCSSSAKCQLCDFVHVSDSDFEQRRLHLINHISDHIFKFQCSKCSNYFCTKYNLDLHSSIKHDQQCQLTCSYCEKTLFSKFMMRQHMKITHSLHFIETTQQNQKTFRSQKSSDGSNKKDKNIVIEPVKIKCSFCKISVANTKELMQHVRTKHVHSFMLA